MSAVRSPLQVPSTGRRERAPLPAPTVANFGDMGRGRDFVALEIPASLRCPVCTEPFEEDGDRYFRGGCLSCGWRRARRGGCS